MLRRARTFLSIALCIALASCASEEPKSDPSGSTAPDELVVQSASFDLAAGEKTRFIAGVLTPDQLFVSYGEVEMKFFYLGTKKGSGTADPGPVTTGEFLAIEGDPSTEGPVAAPGSQGRGVYQTEVTFDRAGYWAVELTAELDGGAATGQSVFQVREEHLIPAVGDKAPPSKNLTLDSKDPKEAVDSRAGGGEEIPDEILHRTTVAQSLARKEPALVVVSTPVYCVSRFCGPVTDTIADLARDYSDRANFIHIEVWYDFNKQTLNRAAAQWIYRKKDLTEPWVFLVGADGKIAARWDNVAVRGEIEPLLRKLPKK